MNNYGTEHDLTKTPYFIHMHDSHKNQIDLFFSTSAKKKRFEDRIVNFIEAQNFKYSLSLKMKCNFDILSIINLYSKCENNGFRILINNKVVHWEDICLTLQIEIKS